MNTVTSGETTVGVLRVTTCRRLEICSGGVTSRNVPSAAAVTASPAVVNGTVNGNGVRSSATRIPPTPLPRTWPRITVTPPKPTFNTGAATVIAVGWRSVF